MTYRTLAVHMVVGLMLLPAMAMAQAQEGGRQRGQGGQGNFDPAQMRDRMMNAMKEQLGATDEEWTVLRPQIEKVQTAQRSARGGAFGMGRGGRGGDRPAEGENAVQTASRELRSALENRNTSAEELTRRLTALREARAKAQAELVAAQKGLKELLTARQEAVLVQNGMLD